MVQRITIAPQGPEFSRFVMGYWRLMDWNMSARQLVSFIEEHLDRSSLATANRSRRLFCCKNAGLA